MMCLSVSRCVSGLMSRKRRNRKVLWKKEKKFFENQISLRKRETRSSPPIRFNSLRIAFWQWSVRWRGTMMNGGCAARKGDKNLS